MFGSSDLAYGVPAADVCIPCIHWGYHQRLKAVESADRRSEIADMFAGDLARLQYRGIDCRGGRERFIEGIFLERDPSLPQQSNERRRQHPASLRTPTEALLLTRLSLQASEWQADDGLSNSRAPIAGSAVNLSYREERGHSRRHSRWFQARTVASPSRRTPGTTERDLAGDSTRYSLSDGRCQHRIRVCIRSPSRYVPGASRTVAVRSPRCTSEFSDQWVDSPSTEFAAIGILREPEPRIPWRRQEIPVFGSE